MKLLSDDNITGIEKKDKIRLGIDGFMIFIYGHNSKIHDSVAGKKGSFDQIIERIEKLNKNNQYVIANVIIKKKNYRYLPSIVKFLAGLDIFHIQLTLLDRTLDFETVKPYIFEALDIKLRPEYEKLEIYFSDSKKPFFLPTVEESLEKMRDREWRKIEPLEIEKRSIERKKSELLKKNKIFDEWNKIEKERKELEKAYNEKWERMRIPKRLELGEMLEKKDVAMKGKLTNSLDFLSAKIKDIEEELDFMWIEEFEQAEKKIIQITGKENLLLKSKRIDSIWKSLNKEKISIENEIDELKKKNVNFLDDKIYELKERKNLLLEKHGISK